MFLQRCRLSVEAREGEGEGGRKTESLICLQMSSGCHLLKLLICYSGYRLCNVLPYFFFLLLLLFLFICFILNFKLTHTHFLDSIKTQHSFRFEYFGIKLPSNTNLNSNDFESIASIQIRINLWKWANIPFCTFFALSLSLFLFCICLSCVFISIRIREIECVCER